MTISLKIKYSHSVMGIKKLRPTYISRNKSHHSTVYFVV